MNIENTLSFYLLLTCNGILVAAASLAILRLQRIARGQKAYWDSPTGMAVLSQKDNDALLDSIEQKITGLLEDFDNFSADERADKSNHKAVPFENAVRMAKHGATLDDLTRTCGLSDIEARLLMRVHTNGAHAVTAS